MEPSPELVQLLSEIRDLLREGAKRQVEMVEFMRANAERSKSAIDQSIGLQEQALKRQKAILRFVIPLIAICVVAIVYVLSKLR